MFERDHHKRIASILRSLDVPMLIRNRCLFGGGSAISFAHGEYRESAHIELFCSSRDGYRDIRQIVTVHDQSWLFMKPVEIVREPRCDQYGIRLAAAVDGIPVKVKIIYEGRIDLNDPLPADRIEGVWTLTKEDLVATKLLANSDRYADDSMMSRDLIDLAMLSRTGSLPLAGITKARWAYGESVDLAFVRGKEQLLEREGRLVKCMNTMQMKMAPEVLRDRILNLHLDPASNRH